MASARTRLNEALADFQNQLTPEEKIRFKAVQSVPDASSVIVLTAQLDQTSVKRNGRCIANRVSPLLTSIQQFSGVIGTFVSSNPAVAALVWGSVGLMLLLANNSISYFDKLSYFLMNIGKSCPRFADYQNVYLDATALQSAIQNYYAELIRCCTHACKMLRNTGWLQNLRNALTSFETEFGPFRDRIEALARDVKYEIQLAAHKANRDAQRAQKQHHAYTSQAIQRYDAALTDKRERSLRKSARDSVAQRQILLEKLSSYNEKTAYNQARARCCRETAEWLTSEPDFIEWASSTGTSTFWLTGKLGCGKSIILSNVIAHLFLQHSNPAVQITYFFCRFDETVSMLASTILRSLVRQCLQPNSLTPNIETALTEYLQLDEQTGDQGLAHLLDLAVSRSPMHFIVIDGIDECTDRERRALLKILDETMRSSSASMKLMLSCRNRIFEDLCPSPGRAFYMPVKESAVATDITLYIAHTLQTKRDDGELVVGDPSLVSEIQAALINGADSMFLWVSFQIDEICYQTCDRDIRTVIENLPASLEETYARILRRIFHERRITIQQAKQIFEWVAVTRRPLTLYELREALAVEKYASSSNSDRLINNAHGIVSWCRGLLVLDEVTDEVHFAHPSVKDAFTHANGTEDRVHIYINLQEADKNVGEICTTYLNFNDFRTEMGKRSRMHSIKASQLLESVSAMNAGTRFAKKLSGVPRSRYSRPATDVNIGQQLLGHQHTRQADRDHPFLAYASEYWLAHSSRFCEQDRIWQNWSLLLTEHRSLASKPWTEEEWTSRGPSLCDYVVELEHTALLVMILSIDSPVSLAHLRWMAHNAAARGSTRLLETIWTQRDRNMNAKRAALVAAAQVGQLQVVGSILDERLGSELPTRTTDQKTEYHSEQTTLRRAAEEALLVAADEGHLDLVKKLLASGVNVNTSAPEFHFGETALQVAARGGFLDVVEKLLAAGADVNITSNGFQNWTALHAAAREGYPDVVGKILAASANVNAALNQSGRWTPLHAAAQGVFLVVEKLSAVGADVNRTSTSCFDQTPLYAAAERGFLDVVEKLLAAGANVDIGPDKLNGRTALQAAAGGGHLDIVERLITAGADTNTKPDFLFCRTALQTAAMGGYLDVVDKLLIAGADINAAPGKFDGRTALQAAAEGGHLNLVEKLLALGADVNAAPAKYFGRTALEAARANGHPIIEQRLLAAGAKEKSPPHRAIQRRVNRWL